MTRFMLTLAAAALLGSVPAAADDATFSEIRAAVNGTIAPALEKEKLTKVSFDWITTSTKAKVLGASGIAYAFEACLEKRGITMVPGQAAVIHVVVSPIDCDPETKLPATRLTIGVTLDGKPLVSCVRAVFGLSEIVVMESLQLAVPPAATPETIADLVKAARKGETPPAAPPAGETKKHSGDKAVSVEMLVGPTVGRAEDFKVAARPLDGKGRAPVKEGESYMLRVSSSLDYPIAISVAIDGLDWANFFEAEAKADAGTEEKEPKEACPKPRLFLVVPAKGTITIKGWAKNLKQSNAFDVARLPTAAAGRQAETGVVTIRYAACWDVGGTPPADEPATGGDLAGVGTERGIDLDDTKRQVQKVVGKFRNSVVLHYGLFKD